MNRLPLPALLVVLTVGCASGPHPSGSGSARNVLTSEQLSEPSILNMNAHQAIQRLRPRWLQSRSSGAGGTRTEPVVFLNGSRYGAVSTLRSIRVSAVESMRYLSAGDATTRWGTGFDGGVILITSRR